MRRRLLIGVLISLGINILMLSSLLALAMRGDFDITKIIPVDVLKIEVPKPPEPTPPPTPTPKPTPTPPPEKTPERPPEPTRAPIAENPTDTGPATVQTAPEIQDTPVSTPAPPSVVNASQLDKPPKILKMIKPAYPPLAKRAGRTGVVRVRFMITSSGNVTNVKVLFAKPKGMGFEDSTAAAVRQWKFEIPRINGRPVGAWVVQTIRFTLE
ncbi:MAG: energy transducer TonB [Alphaproteobacteria bacterium]